MWVLAVIPVLAVAFLMWYMSRGYDDIQKRKMRIQHDKYENGRLNELRRCRSCNKYHRRHQVIMLQEVTGESFPCPHCKKGSVYTLQSEDSSLMEFLENHPECPMLTGKNASKEFYKSIEDLKRAKNEVESQKEIKRITEDYLESGNMYYENLINSLRDKKEENQKEINRIREDYLSNADMNYEDLMDNLKGKKKEEK